MSARRLGVLVRELPSTSRLATELNGGRPVWTQTEHLLADIWVLLARAYADPKRPPPRDFDHPVRAEMNAKAKSAAQRARVSELRTAFEKRKRAYGLEG